jgi:hypothetical protein
MTTTIVIGIISSKRASVNPACLERAGNILDLLYNIY